ncbi:MAG: hypothetical protein DMF56_21805 [Acidobacteria bacterium]|nr:MAG: hypothetical protein DMF56_21805 [Acidobacteriota bacterium]
MALQDRDYLALDGLSILGDPRPSPLQPVIEDGIHLRWAFGAKRAFPLHGYHLFRRGYGEPGEHCLSRYFANLPIGGSGRQTLDTPFGQFSTAEIVATDDFEPRACSELSLTNGALRFDLPLGMAASRVVAKIGILPSTPSETVDQINFRTWPPGDVPNPLDAQGFRFQEFRPGAGLPSIRVLSTFLGVGLECNLQLVITLPRPAFDGVVAMSQTGGLTVAMTFHREDNSVISSIAFGGPAGGFASDISNGTTRIVIDASGAGALLHQIVAKSRETEATIFFSAIHGDKTSTPVVVHGAFGSIATADVTANEITAVAIDSGDSGAALVDLCFWPAAIPILPVESDDIPLIRRRPSGSPPVREPGPWTMVQNFPYPLRLPITHPRYPAATGSESLAANRTQAAQRIRYGTVNDALSAQPATPGSGTLTLLPGSALAKGSGTAWDESLVGRVLYPASTDTAFAIMAVTAPDRMILSRPYTGGTQLSNVAYAFSAEDFFGQLHDQLGALLSEPLGMRAATMPPALESDPARKVILTNGSAVVQGQGTAWSRDLEGLLLEVGTNRDLYRINSINPANQQLTLHAPYAGTSATTVYRIVSRSPNNRIESEPALSIPPLDLLELASLSPAYAQILGLYWNDRSAEAKATYDYIVIADHDGRFHGDGQTALRWLNGSPDFAGDGVDGAQLAASITHTGSGALPPPAALRVFALPAGRPRQTLDRSDLADSEAGLSITDLTSWPSLPAAQQPLLLDVWRLSHGTQTPAASPPAPAAYTQPIDRFAPSGRPAASLAPRPQGWPDPASIHYLDPGNDGLDIGWYSYRLSAIDLWGRFSALSPPIPWVAASGAQLHSYAVHLEDTTPPPPPTDVLAWVLEPETVKDPARIRDAAYLQWRQNIGPNTLGLRLRWRWPWSHALRAPDLAEFRIYAQSTPLNARFHHIVSVSPATSDPTRSDVVFGAADNAPNDAYVQALLQVDDRAYPIEASSGSSALHLRVRNGGPLHNEAPAADRDATIVLPVGHPLHRDLFDPLLWERWLAAVQQTSPPNASVTYGVDGLEDPSIVTYEDQNNPLQGQSAAWNQSAVTIHDLPSGSVLIDVRPGIDVIALASDVPPLYAVLEIDSVDATAGAVRPVMPAPSWLASGTYRWSIGPAERLLWGTAGRWNAAARAIDLPRQPDLSRVRPNIDRIYLRVGAASTPEILDHFFDIAAVDAVTRRLVLNGKLALLTDGALYEWRVGTPSRVYEIFLPASASDDDPKVGTWLAPSLAEPVVYATLGVSAADKRTERPDRRPNRTPARPGNEGVLASPATIFRVQREIPDPPAEVSWATSRLTATRAGYAGKSRFTVRWTKPPAAMRPHYRAVIFRAMDQTLFLTDWEGQRPPLALTTADPAFPAAWPGARKTQTANELAAAQALWTAAATFADAEPHYAALSDDAVSVLANLPGNGEAFAQITIDALSLADPAQDDRLGPDDDPATFPGPSANLNAWLDTLDGLSRNRYLYKVAFVDSAHNRGPLGNSTPPVYLPRVVPPRTPVITKVVGGEREVTIQFALNREPDLAEYRIYATDDEVKSRDVRLMQKVGTLLQSSIAPNAASAEFADDGNLIGRRRYFYRLTAVDLSGNESEPTAAHVGVAVDTTVPRAEWTVQTWLLRRVSDGALIEWPADGIIPQGHQSVVLLGWESEVASPLFVISRRSLNEPAWTEQIRGEAAAFTGDNSGQFRWLDSDVDPSRVDQYLMRVRSPAGVWSITSYVMEIAPPPS